MLTKRYNLINNLGGWFVFLVALITYWLTLEPTASYWDCGEFIIQADKLEVGHPPGNPIFMLTARFFANFAPDAQSVSVMVNAMSGLLSALTILLLFWTISHLVRRLVVRPEEGKELKPWQYVVIMGSALVGSLAYTWSDTFWFSAVEGEVYAFSSFCTALVFWLILKWENRADLPHSDRYLVLIAYIVGVSVAVHLLNLLCIPAIVLVFVYRKWKNVGLVDSLVALGVSFVIIALVLFGLVPGFIKVAQQFELFFVNTIGMSFNSGAIIYVFATALIFAWAIFELYRQKSAAMIRLSFLLAVTMSGMLFFGNGVWFGLILTLGLVAVLWVVFRKRLPVRVLNVIMWSVAVIFVGYSSYALILIRSTADTPMNQNSPDNVFDLAAYLNREQYGENPLLYGETFNSAVMKKVVGQQVDTVYVHEDGTPVTLATPYYDPIVEKGKPLYVKGVHGAVPESEYGFLSESDKAHNDALDRRGGDYYVKRDYKPEAKMNPELNMFFPRLYRKLHIDAYRQWVDLDTMPGNMVEIHALDPESGQKLAELNTNAEPVVNEMTGTVNYAPKVAFKPSYIQNLKYFFNYQLNHMYTRYFMWNFAGRQNDVLNQQGELDAGNWISGIPFIDNPRLGDQSMLPDDLGKNNPGHNVYFMLPLILGLLGLVWQSLKGKEGIEQFWVVFFLFFMTGIAIVLYLNQTPGQPRERDYAFAGSFYAFAIWIGMGVAALANLLGRSKKLSPMACSAIAAVIGLAVPLQMVSQTWDDHDRSGRYAARDYAINYLESLEPNAIVFCNGDNDTFPLWYAQEVEGVRPDVKIINLSYLNSDWYANQQLLESYSAPPVKFTARPQDYAYGRSDVTIVGRENAPADLLTSLKEVYAGNGRSQFGYPVMPSGVVTIPIDKKAVIKRGLVAPQDTALIEDQIVIDLRNASSVRSKGYISLGELLMLDIIATNAANGWERPIYWASTVGDEYHVGLTPYLRSTGMTHQLVPTVQEGMATRPDRAYNVIMNKYRWGGAENAKDRHPYFDETARRMLTTVRSSMVDLASELQYEGSLLKEKDPKGAAAKNRKVIEVLDKMDRNVGESVWPYSISSALTAAQLRCEVGKEAGDKAQVKKGLQMLRSLMNRYAPYVAYNQAMARQFGNPILTYESQLMPFQFYRLIELYESYGGSKKDVDAVMKKFRLNREDLKSNYERYSSRGDYNAGAGEELGITMEDLAAEIAKYCEVANEMAGLSPEEYAARSADEKMIDTQLQTVLDYFLQNGGTEEDLNKFEAYRKLDKERTKRMSEQAQ